MNKYPKEDKTKYIDNSVKSGYLKIKLQFIFFRYLFVI